MVILQKFTLRRGFASVTFRGPQPSVVSLSRVSCRLPIAYFLQLLKFLRYLCCAWSRSTFHGAFLHFEAATLCDADNKILPSDKSSHRRLNTGLALTSRQEATPASAEETPLLCEETPLGNIEETPLSHIEETPLLNEETPLLY